MSPIMPPGEWPARQFPVAHAVFLTPYLCMVQVGAALQNNDQPYRNAICCGLVLSLVGDVLLEMEEALPVLLIFGLTAFLWAKVTTPQPAASLEALGRIDQGSHLL